jgi:hypothetical protein
MNLDTISTTLLSSGAIFISCGLLKEMRDKTKYSYCIRTNFNIGSTLIIAGSALNIYTLTN